jgi:hypothetical protein
MNTEGKTLYIQIPCSEELPEIGKMVIAFSKEWNGDSPFCGYRDSQNNWHDVQVDETHLHACKIEYWLKPVSESKFACDFAEWIQKRNYHLSHNGEWFDQLGTERLSRSFTTSELQQEFLKTYKG